MSYSAPYLDEGGIHLPDYSDRLNELIAGYKRIFGDDVYIGVDTMDYQLLSLVAACWDDLNSVILDTYASRNPNFASGTALDLLLPLNGIQREQATRSFCTLKLTGVAGRTLESGAQAIDENDHIWEIPTEVTFDENGAASAVAYCTEAGAISAGIGTISSINTPVTDWISVTNEAEAILGKNVETDAAVRKRRSLSVSLPSRSILAGIRAALLDISGVNSVNVLENETNIAGDLPPHSICAVVDGGDADEIGRVLWLKKTPGVGTFGDQQVTYIDEFGQSNIMKFFRPTTQNISIRISLRTFAGFDMSLLDTIIPNAITEYINGLDVGESLIVTLLNTVIYNANNATYPVFSVINIEASGDGQTWETDTFSADFKTQLKITGQATVTEVSANNYLIEVS